MATTGGAASDAALRRQGTSHSINVAAGAPVQSLASSPAAHADRKNSAPITAGARSASFLQRLLRVTCGCSLIECDRAFRLMSPSARAFLGISEGAGSDGSVDGGFGGVGSPATTGKGNASRGVGSAAVGGAVRLSAASGAAAAAAAAAASSAASTATAVFFCRGADDGVAVFDTFPSPDVLPVGTSKVLAVWPSLLAPSGLAFVEVATDAAVSLTHWTAALRDAPAVASLPAALSAAVGLAARSFADSAAVYGGLIAAADAATSAAMADAAAVATAVVLPMPPHDIVAVATVVARDEDDGGADESNASRRGSNASDPDEQAAAGRRRRATRRSDARNDDDDGEDGLVAAESVAVAGEISNPSFASLPPSAARRAADRAALRGCECYVADWAARVRALCSGSSSSAGSDGGSWAVGSLGAATAALPTSAVVGGASAFEVTGGDALSHPSMFDERHRLAPCAAAVSLAAGGHITGAAGAPPLSVIDFWVQRSLCLASVRQQLRCPVAAAVVAALVRVGSPYAALYARARVALRAARREASALACGFAALRPFVAAVSGDITRTGPVAHGIAPLLHAMSLFWCQCPEFFTLSRLEGLVRAILEHAILPASAFVVTGDAEDPSASNSAAATEATLALAGATSGGLGGRGDGGHSAGASDGAALTPKAGTSAGADDERTHRRASSMGDREHAAAGGGGDEVSRAGESTRGAESLRAGGSSGAPLSPLGSVSIADSDAAGGATLTASLAVLAPWARDGPVAVAARVDAALALCSLFYELLFGYQAQVNARAAPAQHHIRSPATANNQSNSSRTASNNVTPTPPAARPAAVTDVNPTRSWHFEASGAALAAFDEHVSRLRHLRSAMDDWRQAEELRGLCFGGPNGAALTADAARLANGFRNDLAALAAVSPLLPLPVYTAPTVATAAAAVVAARAAAAAIASAGSAGGNPFARLKPAASSIAPRSGGSTGTGQSSFDAFVLRHAPRSAAFSEALAGVLTRAFAQAAPLGVIAVSRVAVLAHPFALRPPVRDLLDHQAGPVLAGLEAELDAAATIFAEGTDRYSGRERVVPLSFGGPQTKAAAPTVFAPLGTAGSVPSVNSGTQSPLPQPLPTSVCIPSAEVESVSSVYWLRALRDRVAAAFDAARAFDQHIFSHPDAPAVLMKHAGLCDAIGLAEAGVARRWRAWAAATALEALDVPVLQLAPRLPAYDASDLRSGGGALSEGNDNTARSNGQSVSSSSAATAAVRRAGAAVAAVTAATFFSSATTNAAATLGGDAHATLLVANMPPDLSRLLMQVPRMQALGIEPAANVSALVASIGAELRSACARLDTAAQEYNAVLASLTPLERPLFSAQLERVRLVVGEGRTKVVWRSPDLEVYATRLAVAVGSLRGVVQYLQGNTRTFQRMVRLWKEALPAVHTFSSTAEDRQRNVVGELLAFRAVSQQRGDDCNDNTVNGTDGGGGLGAAYSNLTPEERTAKRVLRRWRARICHTVSSSNDVVAQHERAQRLLRRSREQLGLPARSPDWLSYVVSVEALFKTGLTAALRRNMERLVSQLDSVRHPALSMNGGRGAGGGVHQPSAGADGGGDGAAKRSPGNSGGGRHRIGASPSSSSRQHLLEVRLSVVDRCAVFDPSVDPNDDTSVPLRVCEWVHGVVALADRLPLFTDPRCTFGEFVAQNVPIGGLRDDALRLMRLTVTRLETLRQRYLCYSFLWLEDPETAIAQYMKGLAPVIGQGVSTPQQTGTGTATGMTGGNDSNNDNSDAGEATPQTSNKLPRQEAKNGKSTGAFPSLSVSVGLTGLPSPVHGTLRGAQSAAAAACLALDRGTWASGGGVASDSFGGGEVAQDNAVTIVLETFGKSRLQKVRALETAQKPALSGTSPHGTSPGFRSGGSPGARLSRASSSGIPTRGLGFAAAMASASPSVGSRPKPTIVDIEGQIAAFDRLRYDIELLPATESYGWCRADASPLRSNLLALAGRWRDAIFAYLLAKAKRRLDRFFDFVEKMERVLAMAAQLTDAVAAAPEAQTNARAAATTALLRSTPTPLQRSGTGGKPASSNPSSGVGQKFAPSRPPSATQGHLRSVLEGGSSAAAPRDPGARAGVSSQFPPLEVAMAHFLEFAARCEVYDALWDPLKESLALLRRHDIVVPPSLTLRLTAAVGTWREFKRQAQQCQESLAPLYHDEVAALRRAERLLLANVETFATTRWNERAPISLFGAAASSGKAGAGHRPLSPALAPSEATSLPRPAAATVASHRASPATQRGARASSPGASAAAAVVPTGPPVAPRDAYKRLFELHLQVSDLLSQQQRLQQRQRLFGVPPCLSPGLTTLQQDLVVLKSLWDVTAVAESHINAWRGVPLARLDHEGMEETLKKVYAQFKAFPKRARDWPLYFQGEHLVADVLTMLPLVLSLRQPCIKENHWRELMDQTGFHFAVSDDIAIDQLMVLRLHEHADAVSSVVEKAQREQQIERQLQTLKQAWRDRRLTFTTPNAETGISLVHVPEELVLSIEENQALLQQLMATRYAAGFMEELQAYQAALTTVESVTTLLCEAQNTWSYLLAIFLESKDVQKQLPQEAARFKEVDTSIRGVLRTIRAYPGSLLDICTKTSLEGPLRDVIAGLNQCERALDGYMEVKRRAMPRLYFLSTPDLLDMLSAGSHDAGRTLQRHLGKLLPGVSGVTLSAASSATSTTSVPAASSMLSANFVTTTSLTTLRAQPRQATRAQNVGGASESSLLPPPATKTGAHDASRNPRLCISGCTGIGGEQFSFAPGTAVVCTGKVESWLGEIVLTMQRTVHQAIKVGLVSFGAGDTPRDVWIRQTLSQVALVVGRVYWTAMTVAAFAAMDDGNEHAMRDHRARCESSLEELVRIVQRGDTQDHGERTKLMNLVTYEVHGRDVVAELASHRVDNPLGFAWASQLRQRFDDRTGTVHIDVCDTTFEYGGEYLGNSLRLVLTPLTTRINVTLTQALHLRLGGAAAGPAGTGKTESTKDLGAQMGKPVFVFNCSEQMTSLSLGSTFKGLSASGAWGCFDEFNRIALEVLSVLSSQLKCVLDGLRERRKAFFFLGAECALDPTCGVFVTMNPGYAGRTELPESLKALFRPVTVVVPDVRLICENMLMAEGFTHARPLARKFIGVCQLSDDLLSKQAHYDWGLRAVKSLLVVAGRLRRASPNTPEDAVMMRALRDFNIPKIASTDADVFRALVSDFFPGLAISRLEAPHLEEACRSACGTLALHPDEALLLRTAQLSELLSVRHSVFLLGPPGSGKSSVWRALMGGLRQLGDRITVRDLNPKSVQSAELYGGMTVTKEWKDGLLTCTMREMCATASGGTNVATGGSAALANAGVGGAAGLTTSASVQLGSAVSASGVFTEGSSAFAGTPSLPAAAAAVGGTGREHRWVVLDGELDTEWIESMNSVMDDNKVLTLANNERIILPPQVRLLFEIGTLNQATPATVSRAGILYLTGNDVSWQALTSVWLEGRAHQALLSQLVDRYLPPCLEYLRTEALLVVPLSTTQSVRSLCVLCDALVASDMNEKDVESVFLFCVVWSFGGAMSGAEPGSDGQPIERQRFDRWWRKQLWRGAAKFPPAEQGTVLDFYFSAETRRFERWADRVPIDTLSDGFLFPPAAASTAFVLDTFLAARHPVLLIGPSGTGKSVMCRDRTSRLPTTTHRVLTVHMHSDTTSASLQATLEMQLERKVGRTFQPLGGKRLVVCLEDFNAPAPDAYGSQAALALVRQHLDYAHWFDRSKWTLRDVRGVQYVAVVNPVAASTPLESRLGRHFAPLVFGPPTRDDAVTMMSAVLSPHVPHSDRVVNAAIEVHDFVCRAFPRTIAAFHYNFSLRHLCAVVSGVNRLTPGAERAPGRGAGVVARLLLHELRRVYVDPMRTTADAAACHKAVHRLVAGTFTDVGIPTETTSGGNRGLVVPMLAGGPAAAAMGAVSTSTANPSIDPLEQATQTIFTSFHQGLHALNPYEEAPSVSALRATLEIAQREFSDLGGASAVNLALFEEACLHVARVCRLLHPDYGSNVLFVGAGGSGKQSLTRLAAHVCGHSVVSPGNVAADLNAFRDQLRRMAIRGGVKGEGTVLLVNETHAAASAAFLMELHATLSQGVAPDLLSPDERESVLRKVAPEVRSQLLVDSKDNLWEYFAAKAKRYSRIVFCCSPGDRLRTWCRRFPSLASLSVLWFHPWTPSALEAVAERLLTLSPATSARANPNSLGGSGTTASSSMVFASAPAILPPCAEVPAAVRMLTWMFATACEAAAVASASASSSPSSSTAASSGGGGRSGGSGLQLHFTPKTFIDTVKTFLSLYSRRVHTLEAGRARYALGLARLRRAAQDTVDVQAVLATTRVVAEEKRVAAESLLVRLNADRAVVVSENSKAEGEAHAALEIQAQVATASAECDDDLARAEPVLRKAAAALDTLNKANLTELKSFKNPPAEVQNVLSCVVVLLGPTNAPPQRDRSWGASQRLMQRVDVFLTQLKSFDKDGIPEAFITAIRPYLDNPGFSGDAIIVKSLAAAGLCEWVRNIAAYHKVYWVVKPKRDAAAATKLRLDEANAKLAKSRAHVSKLRSQLAEVQAAFDAAEGERQTITAEVASCESRLLLAQRLVLALGDERERWTAEVERFTLLRGYALGDTLLASGFVGYAGGFAMRERRALVQGRWHPHAKTLGILSSLTPETAGCHIPASTSAGAATTSTGGGGGTSTTSPSVPGRQRVSTWGATQQPHLGGGSRNSSGQLARGAAGKADEVDHESASPASILYGPSDAARWQNEGLPSDTVSIENAAIVTTATRVCLLVDPQLQGLAWLRRHFAAAAPASSSSSAAATKGSPIPPTDAASSSPPLHAPLRSRGADIANVGDGSAPQPTAAGTAAAEPPVSSEKNALRVISASQPDELRSTIKSCVSRGTIVVVEILDGHTIDPFLAPLILRQTLATGVRSRPGGLKSVTLDDHEYVVHPTFRLFLHTRLAAPIIGAETQAEVTVVNFTVTPEGLEEQLLSVVLRSERRQADEDLRHAVHSINTFQIAVTQLEDALMQQLAVGTENRVEDGGENTSNSNTKRPRRPVSAARARTQSSRSGHTAHPLGEGAQAGGDGHDGDKGHKEGQDSAEEQGDDDDEAEEDTASSVLDESNGEGCTSIGESDDSAIPAPAAAAAVAPGAKDRNARQREGNNLQHAQSSLSLRRLVSGAVQLGATARLSATTSNAFASSQRHSSSINLGAAAAKRDASSASTSTPADKRIAFKGIVGAAKHLPVPTKSGTTNLRHTKEGAAGSGAETLLDEAVVSGTERLKVTARDVAAKVRRLQAIQQELRAQIEVYRPVAARGTRLFFVVRELHRLEPLYQYSLAWFLETFQRAISGESARVAKATAVQNPTDSSGVVGRFAGDIFGRGGSVDGGFGLDYRTDNVVRGPSASPEGNVRPTGATGAAATTDGHDAASIAAARQQEEWVARRVSDALVGVVTSEIFAVVRRGLFERHALTAASVLALSILEHEGRVPPALLRFMLTGDADPNPSTAEGGAGSLLSALANPTYLSRDVWRRTVALSTGVPGFERLVSDMEGAPKRWRDWFESERPEQERIPGDWRTAGDAAGLLLIRVLRPDRFVAACSRLVTNVLGSGFVEPVAGRAASLGDIVRDAAGPATPVLYLLFPGADPAKEFEALARKTPVTALGAGAGVGGAGRGAASVSIGRGGGLAARASMLVTASVTFTNVALGEGQQAAATSAVRAACSRGGWVLLQNAHLLPAWMPQLEALLEAESGSAHRDFRLLITAEPSIDPQRALPPPLVQRCLKVVNEPPQGLRASLARALASFGSDFFESSSRPGLFKPALFALSVFHSLMAGRSKFGAAGWMRPYAFNSGDLSICAQQLHAACEQSAYSGLAWTDLHALFADIVYGGHITDPWDRRVGRAYLETLLCDATPSEGSVLSPGIVVPPLGPSHNYLAAADALPSVEGPHVYGVPLQAEAACLAMRGDAMVQHMGLLLASTTKIGGSVSAGATSSAHLASADSSTEARLRDMVEEVLARLPDVSTCDALVAQNFVATAPLTVVQAQEHQRLSTLVTFLRNSLAAWLLGLRGRATLDSHDDEGLAALARHAVPPQWAARGPTSLSTSKGLRVWLDGIADRVKHLESWASSAGSAPRSLWLGGLFNPQALFTAVLQAAARKSGTPLEHWRLYCEVLRKTEGELAGPPREGLHVHGLFLSGARWDTALALLAELGPRDAPHTAMPVVHLRAVPLNGLLGSADGGGGGGGTIGGLAGVGSGDPSGSSSLLLALPQRPAASGSGAVHLGGAQPFHTYSCPLYASPNRGSSFVASLPLRCSEPPRAWILRGACVLLSTE